METPKNEIKKAVIKKDRLNVSYAEAFKELNYTNDVSKCCDQIIHHDLSEAFKRLKIHLIVLCEQPESGRINAQSIKSPGLAETFPNYNIVGYSHDSDNGTVGVTIFGQKLLQSGRVVDLRIFAAAMDDNYPFADELSLDIQACDWEVYEYLFSEKWGIKQEMLDFDSDTPESVSFEIAGENKKKAKRKKEPIAFDETA